MFLRVEKSEMTASSFFPHLLFLLLASFAASKSAAPPIRPKPGEIYSAYFDNESSQWSVKLGSDGLASASYLVRRP